MTETYKHTATQLDPRDKNLCYYSKATKRFIIEASDMEARGIQQQYVPNTHAPGGADYYIYLWSEKYNLAIPYRACDNLWSKEGGGELVASVWRPAFATVLDQQTALAAAAAMGTEIHLLND